MFLGGTACKILFSLYLNVYYPDLMIHSASVDVHGMSAAVVMEHLLSI